MQIADLKAEIPDHPLPYEIALPHANASVPITRLVCFTAARFVNQQSLADASESQLSGTRKRGRSEARAAADAHGAEPQAGALETAGVPLLASIMTSCAPARLQLSQVVELVAAGAFCNAGPLLALLPCYLKPILCGPMRSEVRRTLLCARSMS